MIVGRVNDRDEPICEIEIIFHQPRKFSAVIDTGFNGYISIPQKIIFLTGWRFIGHDEYELASGEILKERVYLGEVIFDGKKQPVYALANRTDDILIGTKLLDDKILSIDFKSKKLKVY